MSEGDVCRFCGGSGELWRLTNENPNSASDELVPCSTCGGSGFERTYKRLVAPKKKTNLKDSPAYKAAVAAIDKQFAKKEKK